MLCQRPSEAVALARVAAVPCPPALRLRPGYGGRRQLRARASQQQEQAAAPGPCRPLEVSRSLAVSRAREAARPDALFADPWAAALSAGAQQQQPQQQLHGSDSLRAAADVVATAYIDESLANAMDATSTNTIQAGDYRQVVLFGDGMDTRPFRLPWPPGTLLFLVAPAEVHEQAEALLAAAPQPPHVARGCLLRRVNLNLAAAEAAAAEAAAEAAAGIGPGSSAARGSDDEGAGRPHAAADLHQQQAQQQPEAGAAAAGPASGGRREAGAFAGELQRAGFRADRLSVWALQGLHGLGLGPATLQQLLAELTNLAAFHSLLVGELPVAEPAAADNLLAEAGLLGAAMEHGAADAGGYGRWPAVQQQQRGGGGGGLGRLLVTAQQLRLSLLQMGVYDEWSAEYEATDFGDDFVPSSS